MSGGGIKVFKDTARDFRKERFLSNLFYPYHLSSQGQVYFFATLKVLFSPLLFVPNYVHTPVLSLAPPYQMVCSLHAQPSISQKARVKLWKERSLLDAVFASRFFQILVKVQAIMVKNNYSFNSIPQKVKVF